MAVKVRIPVLLRPLTGGAGEVESSGAKISELIDNLEAAHPGIKERLYGDDGKLRRFINIYVNNEDIRFLQGEDTPVKDGDEISIVPAIAGGSA